jgi:hypothetical protein
MKLKKNQEGRKVKKKAELNAKMIPEINIGMVGHW